MLLADEPQRHKPVKYVIFDLDGTLLDTEVILVDVTRKILAQYGKSYDDGFGLKNRGTTLDVFLVKVIEYYELPLTFEALKEEFKDNYYHQLVHNVKLMPGAERLVDHLHMHNIPLAIATGSSRSEFNLYIPMFPTLFEKFHHVTTSDEVDHPKPNPETFLRCASLFPEMPEGEDVLVIEDSVNGVEAARRANMQVVMVPDEKLQDHLTGRAHHVVKTLLEFDPILFHLPEWDD